GLLILPTHPGRPRQRVRSGVGLRYGVADPVHAQRVGLPRAARRAAGHDDDLVAAGAPAESDQLAVDLMHHVDPVPHLSHSPRLPAGRAAWLRGAVSEVISGSGIGDRSLASRRAVPPVIVNATSAFAPTIAPTSAAARAIAPPVVVGTRVSACSARSEVSSA